MVECTGLENRQVFAGLVGSNPTLSASIAHAFRGSLNIAIYRIFYPASARFPPNQTTRLRVFMSRTKQDQG